VNRSARPEVSCECRLGIDLAGQRGLRAQGVILLIEEGSVPPFNLPGLDRARYSGGKRDCDATIKLPNKFSEFKSYGRKDRRAVSAASSR